MRRIFWLLTVLCLLFSATAWAEPTANGEKLVRELWASSATKQLANQAGMISPAFQSVYPSGARNKAQEMASLDEVTFTKFELSGFRTSQQGPVAVVTYLAKVEEMKGALRVDGKTSPRMSVFIHTNKGWQWLAHASIPAP